MPLSHTSIHDPAQNSHSSDAFTTRVTELITKGVITYPSLFPLHTSPDISPTRLSTGRRDRAENIVPSATQRPCVTGRHRVLVRKRTINVIRGYTPRSWPERRWWRRWVCRRFRRWGRRGGVKTWDRATRLPFPSRHAIRQREATRRLTQWRSRVVPIR